MDLSQRVAALGLPAEVSSRFAADMAALWAAGGVRALVVYGSAARGRYRPGHSDLNVVVVLQDGAPDTLDRISGPLHQATRHVGLEPFILTAGEILRAADVFPTKFADIAAYHVLLAGEDPFAELVIPHAHLRLRVEQELRNLCLRLRRRYVGLRQDPQRLAESLGEALPGICIEFEMLLRLTNRAAPERDDPRGVLAAAAPLLGMDPAVLSGVTDIRSAEPGEVHRHAHLLLQALARAADVADGAEERAAG